MSTINSSTILQSKDSENVFELVNHLSNLYQTHNYEDLQNHDHNHGNEHNIENKSNVIVAKVTAMCVLFIASMVCGMIPFKLSQWFKWTATSQNGAPTKGSYATHLLAFGGGVLLCTTFLHMLPEVTENMESLRNGKHLPEFLNTSAIHLGPLLMCLGFFAMYFVEELVHLYLHRLKHSVHSSSQCDGNHRENSTDRNNSVRISNNKDVPTGSSNLNVRFGNKKKASISVAELISSTENNETEIGNVIGINYVDSINEAHDKRNGIHRNENPCLKTNYNNMQTISNSQLNNNNTPCDALTASPLQHSEELKHEYEHGGYSHLPIDSNVNDHNVVSSLRGLLIVLALSVHELFEGLAVGLESSAYNVWYMFGAVATHKLVIAFCVGIELIVNKTRFCLSILYICTFAIVSPIGIGMGILISWKGTPDEILKNENLLIFDETDGLRNDSHETNKSLSPNVTAVVLQGLATGTLLYVVFFEILAKGRTVTSRNTFNGLLQFIAVVVGFSVMFGMQFLGKQFKLLCLLNLKIYFSKQKMLHKQMAMKLFIG